MSTVPAYPLAIRDPREAQIAAGSVLITAKELAPRIGLHGKWAFREVLLRARAGRIPAYRPNKRTILFHLPTVMAHVASGKGRVSR